MQEQGTEANDYEYTVSAMISIHTKRSLYSGIRMEGGGKFQRSFICLLKKTPQQNNQPQVVYGKQWGRHGGAVRSERHRLNSSCSPAPTGGVA